MLVPGITAGQEFFTTNTHSLTRFIAKVDSADRPVTIVSFGDSMADSYRSITFGLVNKFRARFGTAGHSLNSYANATLRRLTNGASVVPRSGRWFTEHIRVPEDGSVWWHNEKHPSGLLSDRLGVFWVAHPEGGKMEFSVSANGGPWTTLRELQGFSPLLRGCFTNVTLPLDHHRIRVQGISGTNYVIGPHLLNTQTNGVHFVFMDEPGISLHHVTNVGLAVRSVVLAALEPDLLIWHMKETGTEADRPGLEECEQWWTDSAPGCDVVYIGTPYTIRDIDSTQTTNQNSIVRSVAIQHGRAYMDCMTPGTSYEWLVLQGYMADTVHLNRAGGEFFAELMWNDLGFFGLRIDRRIGWTTSGTGIELTWNTTTNIHYALQQSSNRADWTTVASQGGDGLTAGWSCSVSETPLLFRLELRPK